MVLPYSQPFSKNKIPEWFTLKLIDGFGRKFLRKKKSWIEEYGNSWQIAHVYGKKVLTPSKSLELVESSYQTFFEENMNELEEILATNSGLSLVKNKTSDGELDYTKREDFLQYYADISVRRVLQRLGKQFSGENLIIVEKNSAEDNFFSPGRVPFINKEVILPRKQQFWFNRESIQDFWQSNAILQVRTNLLLKKSPIVLVIALRRDLKLGKGKFCAQASHSVVSSVFFRKIKDTWFEKWHSDNEEKIEIWTVKNDNALTKLIQIVKRSGVNWSDVVDAGHTQIPSGTRTCVALGPAPSFLLQAMLNQIPDSIQGTKEFPILSFQAR